MLNFQLKSRIFTLWANFLKKRPMEYFETHSIIIWEGSPKRFDHWFEWLFCFRIQTLKTDRVWAVLKKKHFHQFYAFSRYSFLIFRWNRLTIPIFHKTVTYFENLICIKVDFVKTLIEFSWSLHEHREIEK